MAKGNINRLTARTVAAARVGMHCDGNNLYLQVTKGTDGGLNRSWLLRYATGEIKTSANGKSRRAERQMGLGSYPRVTLVEAREKAREALKLLAQGHDPIEAKRNSRAAAALASAKAITFKECAEACIRSHERGWRNESPVAQHAQHLRLSVYRRSVCRPNRHWPRSQSP